MKTNSYITYRRMLSNLKPFWFLFLFAAILSTLVSVIDGASIWFLSTLPKLLFAPETATIVRPEFSIHTVNEMLKYFVNSFVMSKANALELICIFIVIAFFLKNGITFISKAITHHVNLSISRNMRDDVYRHVLNLPVSYFDKNEAGKILAYILHDLGVVNSSLTSTLQVIAMEPMRLIINVSILLMINWKLTLMVFVIYPVLGWIIIKIGKSVKRKYTREVTKYQSIISMLSETLGGIRAIKMFNMHNDEHERFATANHEHKILAIKSNITKDAISPITELLGITVTVGLLWYSGRTIIAGNSLFTADDFIRFIFFLIASYQPLKSIGNTNNTLQSGLASAQRIYGLIDEKEEILHAPGSMSRVQFSDTISFNDVHFTYPGFDNEVLTGLTFTAKKGSAVAIIGSSGAGKSTILDLLPRFYDITSGTISIDGISTSDMDLVALRSLFGIVSQETILFNISIRENISYGVKATEEELIHAVKSANALEFIEKMPNGFDTIIGERGVTLSGGQRQRLAIARALLRNPQILIFDEATSALDTESEKLVQEAIDNLTENRTAFIVAHRLSTVLHADKIIVLEEGKVIESGTHDELITLGNRYKYFYDIQFNKEIVR